MGKISMTGIPQMTWIPSYIIEEIMRETPGGEFKALMALYHAAQKNGTFTTQAMASLCGFSEVDAISCCEYWNNKGILTIHTMDSAGNLELEFNQAVTLTDETGQKRETRASDHSETLANSDFRDLIGALEMSMGKPMSPSQLRFTLELKDDFGFDDEVIMLLYGYCAGKESVRYMEQVAASWREKKVKTAEEANAVIRKFEDKWSNHRELFKYMGMDPSSIAKPQEEQLDRWFETYGFDLVMVKHAAGRCINQLGKADLNYIEGILKRWRKDGIKTVADAMKKDTLPKGNKPVQGRKDVTSFNNYDQRTYDYDSLEKRLLGWRDEDE